MSTKEEESDNHKEETKKPASLDLNVVNISDVDKENDNSKKIIVLDLTNDRNLKTPQTSTSKDHLVLDLTSSNVTSESNPSNNSSDIIFLNTPVNIIEGLFPYSLFFLSFFFSVLFVSFFGLSSKKRE